VAVNARLIKSPQQFENIARLKEKYKEDGNPIISVDTKKKSF
jgi:hypothetical protein